MGDINRDIRSQINVSLLTISLYVGITYMAFCTKNPRVTTVHRTSLSSFKHEFIGRSAFGGVRAKFLFRKIERHYRGLTLVGRFELMKVSRRKHVPKGVLTELAKSSQIPKILTSLEYSSSDTCSSAPTVQLSLQTLVHYRVLDTGCSGPRGLECEDQRNARRPR